MISDASVATLISWRKKTAARLSQVKKEEAALREIFRTSASALQQARYHGKKVTWEDHAAVLKMLEDIVVGVMHMMTIRSTDLELHLEKIDKLAAAELPPDVSHAVEH